MKNIVSVAIPTDRPAEPQTILVNFIVEHGVDLGDEIIYLISTPWKLYFN